MKQIYIFFLLIIISHNCIAQTIYYVDASKPDNSGDGLSWATAKRDVQEAIFAAGTSSQIWIKEGTYKPTSIYSGSSSDPRNRNFYDVGSKNIYGGFAGNETQISQRNLGLNVTIFSGDLNGNSPTNIADDVSNLLYIESSPSPTIIDGITFKYCNGETSGAISIADQAICTIRNCNFFSNYSSYRGGAINAYRANFTLENCNFVDNINGNYGGGAIKSALCISTIKNCNFTSNHAQLRGGAISLSHDDASITNCKFSSNDASEGGALDSYLSSLNITNSQFFSNYAIQDGGAVSVETGSNNGCLITNCSFSNNFTINSLGISLKILNFYGGNSTIRNCILWGNNAQVYVLPGIDFTYCCVQGGVPGIGNINTNPLYVGLGDLRLQSTSPCINAGDPAVNTPTTDLVGYPRIGRFDMGAREYCDVITINSQPTSTTGVVGNSVYFTVAASATTSNYQWKKNGTTIVGANSPTLTLNNLTTADAGNYSCEISNFCNTVTSANAALTVNTTQKIWYVKPTGNNGNTGLSWAAAKADIQAAINAAGPSDWIWVKAGTYKPTDIPTVATGAQPTGDRFKTFHLKNGVKLFGGFNGTETLLSQQNATTNITILSGDLDNNSPATISDDAYHVILSINDNTNTELNGFTVESGYASGGPGSQSITVEGMFNYVDPTQGGGMYNYGSSTSVTNCVFRNCRAQLGGAIQNYFNSNNSISNCKFLNNTAEGVGGGGGGAINNGNNSDPDFSNCIFDGNSTTASGGAVYISFLGNGRMTNCIFTNNTANQHGGAMIVQNSGGATSTDITNCTFYGNRAIANSTMRYGGAIYFDAGTTGKISNSIFSNNTTPNNATDGGRENIYCSYNGTGSGILVAVTNCLIDDASSNPLTYTNASLTNCINGNPLFASTSNLKGIDNNWGTADDGLILQVNSPCLDAASNSLIPNGVLTDLKGETRIQGYAADMGAYEKCTNAFSFIDTISVLDLPYTMYGTTFTYTKRNDTNRITDMNGCDSLLDISIRLLPYTKYVDSAAANNHSGGYSWATAFKNLDSAIAEAIAGDTIWVKTGTYQTIDSGIAFAMKKGVVIYGGFAGNETSFNQRNHIINKTILKGNGTNVILNLYNNLDSTSILDGFTITNGSALDHGGGLYNYFSNPSISNCVFVANNALLDGGAIFNYESSPSISNCVFSNNSASGNGGGIYNSNSSPIINNCVFSENQAANEGNQLYNSNSNCKICNTTFSKNSVSSNSSLYNNDSSVVQMSNSILYTNSGTNIVNSNGATAIVTYSDIIDSIVYAGAENINALPQFLNVNNAIGADSIWRTSDDGLRLNCNSPCLNIGNNDSVVNVITDLAGLARIQDNTVDMGAYESASSNPIHLYNTNSASSKYQNLVENYGNCDSLLATITASGTNPISGLVDAKVWVDTVQNPMFVKRHYELTPAVNANTATGKVTLYFTQQEFDDYNAIGNIMLPTDSMDVIGKSNLIVEKRSGISNDGSGLPNTYTGAVTNIDPFDTDIIWNSLLNRWEISFDVDGFSGFFISALSSPLGLSAINFNVHQQNSYDLLQWQNILSDNTSSYEVQHSNASATFQSIGVVKGNITNNYRFINSKPYTGINYYRLKIMDSNGSTHFSKTLSTYWNLATNQMSIYPNPAQDEVNVIFKSNSANTGFVKVIDLQGKIVLTQKVNIVYGANKIGVNLKGLASGVYHLQLIADSGIYNSKLYIK